MKRIGYILFFLGWFACFGQNINRNVRFPADPFLNYPNKSNPNPELITNDAASLDVLENVNAITLISENSVNATRTSVASTNGYTNFSREIEATITGTSIRDRLEVNSILIVGQIYQVDVVHFCNTTTDNTRILILGPTTAISDIHASHTNAQLHSYEFTANQTTFEQGTYVRVNSTAGEKVTYNTSLKLKND